MPLIKDASTVVNDHGIIGKVHNAPVLKIGESVVVTGHKNVARGRLDVHLHVGIQPEFSSVDSDGVVKGIIHGLTAREIEGQDLTSKAVVDRIGALYYVPFSRD
jgi:hypothetical protein